MNTQFYVNLFTKMQEVEKQNDLVRALRGGSVESEDDEAEQVQAAWKLLQDVPSYCEQQAAAFVAEKEY